MDSIWIQLLVVIISCTSVVAVRYVCILIKDFICKIPMKKFYTMNTCMCMTLQLTFPGQLTEAKLLCN